MSGFYVYLSSDACEKLFSTNTKASFSTQLGSAIELDPQYRWSVALAEIIFPSDSNNKIALAQPGTSVGPVFIYSDCVGSSHVGDSFSRLLRIVSPAKSHQTFPDRFYIPVVEERIQRISILAATRLGGRYPLASGVEPLVVVLHFQRDSI